MMTTATPLIAELAVLASQHKLVPFLGAGCSKQQLGVDWNVLTAALAAELTDVPAGVSNPEVAELYVQHLGADRFSRKLEEYLIISSFDERKGDIDAHIIGLELRSVYTTNQDNVYEKACEFYGRKINVLATIEDFSKTRPGDRVLYKFHGDLSTPSSIVYTQSQYDERMADLNHPLDIRLRSDLLAKHLLFVGYSFQDLNVHLLFKSLKDRFGHSLPGSYLLAYNWSDELDSLCAEYGVKCISPAKHITDPTGDPDRDLESFLYTLGETTLSFCTQESIQSMFSEKTPSPQKIVLRKQMENISQLAKKSPAAVVINSFRAACDTAYIPTDLQALVAKTLLEICRNAGPDAIGDIAAALLHLNLDIEHRVCCAAGFITLSNQLTENTEIDISTMFIIPNFPDPLMPVAVAYAVKLLSEWKRPLTEGFYSRAHYWFDAWDQTPDEVKAFCVSIIDKAWASGSTTYENPIQQAIRLQNFPKLKTPRFNELHEAFSCLWPKEFLTPAGD